MRSGTGRIVRIYRWFASLLLPEEMRGERFGSLVEVFEDVLHGARRRGGLRGMVGAALREFVSLALLALRARWPAADGIGSPMPNPEFNRPVRGRGVGEMWSTIIGEVRHAIRSAVRHPVVSVVVVVTLAIGIGANVAVFSVVRGVLIDPLDYVEPERVVSVGEIDPDGRRVGISYENALDLRESAASIEALALFVGNSVAVSGIEGPAERIRGLFVNAEYFDVVGVHPELGRAIEPGEDEPYGVRTAVLSHGYWQRRFGGDPGVLGQVVRFNNEPHTIVGVMPDGFLTFWDDAAAWISLQTVPRAMDRGARNFQAMARVADGFTIQQATEEIVGVSRALEEAFPATNTDYRAEVRAMLPLVRAGRSTLLLTLLVSVGMVLLIACANLANLQLARISSRGRELAVRAALGGSRRRITWSALSESLLLAGVGGAAGTVLAYVGVGALVRLQPTYATYYHVRPDATALGFALVLTLSTAVLFGLIPALRASGAKGTEVLREGGRGLSGSRASMRLRSVLVTTQVATTVVLLIGAGLLTQSLRSLTRVEVGFDTASLLTFEFRLPENKYDTPERLVGFFDEVLDGIRRLPGVEGAESARALPFSGNGGLFPIYPEGEDPQIYQGPSGLGNQVTPGYFELMGIPLLEGRTLRDSDVPGTPLSAVASQNFVETIWPGESGVGKRFLIDPELGYATIVGVVGDVRTDLAADPPLTVYASIRQLPTAFSSIAVRTTGPPLTLSNSVRQVVATIDPDQPIWEIMPITERIGGSVADERFFTVLLSMFSLIALVLASIGIYGVLRYTVSLRSQEIGVRVVLGAGRTEIVRLVVRQGLWTVGVGVLVGLVTAFGASRVLQANLFGVDPRDPLTFGVVPTIVLLVALLATVLPARGATRVDPVEILQES